MGLSSLLLALLVGATCVLSAQAQVTILVQPMEQTNIVIGEDIMFSVNATGNGTVTYQWQKDGVNIMDTADTYSGTATATLTVLSVNISDEGNYTCDVNGSITNPARLTVVAVCTRPSPLMNGMVDPFSAITEGMTVTYNCTTGYNLTGDMTRTCGSDGMLTLTEPTCEAVDCGSLTAPLNGGVNVTVTTLMNTAVYSCNTGYSLTGSSTRTCDSNGMWTPAEPSCTPVDCGSLDAPPNGTVDVPVTTFMNTATYSCNTGYSLTGSSIRTCDSSGMWTLTEPSCTPVDCGSLSAPPNGSVNVSVTTFMNIASYSCNTGYNLTGSSTRTCNSNGMWTPAEPSCRPVDCGSLTAPPNGTVTTPSGTTFINNATATYICTTGYNLTGDMTRTCGSDGMWTLTEPSCPPVDCGSLTDPPNGIVNVPVTTFMNTATYNCITGFNLTGDMTRICGSDGMWSPAEPTCETVDCGSLSAPLNGGVNVTVTTFMNTAVYSCNTGYNLTGSSTRTCDSNGMWTPAEPTCDADCGVLSVMNGQVAYSGATTFNNTASYSCDTDYILEGVAVRVCQANGNWSEMEPTCEVALPVITNQPTNAENLIPGDSATFTVLARGLDVMYEWSMVSRDMLMDEPGKIMGSNNSTLTVLNVTEEDVGMYVCEVSNTAGTINSTAVSLSLLNLPTAVVSPTELVVSLSDSVTFSCTGLSDDDMNNQSWSRVSITTESPNVTTFTLDNVTRADRGEYTCTVENARGSFTAVATLYVIVANAIPAQTVPTANSVTFMCIVEGAPDNVQYAWTQMAGTSLVGGGNPVYRFSPATVDRVTGMDTQNLTISNVARIDDTYSYVCNVTVDGMVIDSSTAELTVVGPTIVRGFENSAIDVDAFTSLNLSCTGENPPGAVNRPFFVWLVGIDVISNSDGRWISDTRNGSHQVVSVLTIHNLTSADSGVYFCQVHNRDPLDVPDTSNITVTVFFTPTVNFKQSTYTTKVGTNVEIKCTVEARPPAMDYQIVQISEGNETSLNYTGPTPVADMVNTVTLSYTIRNPTLDLHNTVFECRATNRNGQSSASTTLNVIDVPGTINHTAITHQLMSLLSVKFTVPAPADNNSPILRYSFLLCPFNVCVSVTPVVIVPPAPFVIGDLQPETNYSVFVVAHNSAGAGEASSSPFTFNSPSGADAAVINLGVTIRTNNALLFSWKLPDLALAAPATTMSPINFTVVSLKSGDSSSNTTIIPYSTIVSNTFGFSLVNLLRDTNYTVSVSVTYTTPFLTSDIVTETGTTLFVDPPPLVSETPQALANNENVLSFSWTTPANVDHLVQYVVTYSVLTNSRRRKRQQGQNFMINTTMPMAGIPNPEPFTEYRIDVDGQFMPPGATSVITVPVTPTTTLRSAAQIPNAPTDIGGNPSIGAPYTSLDISWTLPNEPNGILTTCSISAGGESGSVDDMGSGVPTSITLPGLMANTLYNIEVYCSNVAGDGPLEVGPGTTNVGVKPPIISASIGQSRTINVRLLSSAEYGPHSFYEVIVTTDANYVRNDVGMLMPYSGVDGPSTYVAIAADTNGFDGTFDATIGEGDSPQYNGERYANPMLVQDVYLYVIVRLSFNANTFNDSEIKGPFRFDAPLNIANVIGPIAAIAIILLLVLIGLLVFAACRVFAPVRVRDYSPGGEDGVEKRGKKSNAIELRRTRLFSPILNVGSPDVFTSAGQPTTIICEASGTPAPEVTWTKDGEALDKERFIQLADGSLFINDTDLQDEGGYLVTAVNSSGNAEQLVKVTVLRPVPPEPDEDHPIVRAGDFTEQLALLRTNDDEALEDEYADIELDWTFTSYAAKLNINKNKNRYVNIIPYDHSRIVLSLQDNTPGSDYINGSFIDGFNKPNDYIATQGPIPSTFPDFWRMVWEMDSPTIVMVTNLKEEDKVKCNQYWPSYGTTTYGNIQVTLKEVENLAEYSIRTFTVTPLAGQSRVQMPVREVRQFHFLVWPDHGVPQYATALITFRKRVRRYHPDKRGPMVIHCSAGVGRTGTFITIDVLLKQIEAEGTLDIFNFVRQMRFRRNYMVQTSSQYVFIHDALLESIMCGDNSIPAPELKDKLRILSEVNPDTGKSNFASQFDTLNTASPADDEFDCSVAQLPDNASKNRFKEHLPSNEYRVVLESEDDQSDYICASFVDGYRHRHNFVVTQAPLGETVGDFWRMVWEQKSAAIITLIDEPDGDGDKVFIKYWPTSTEEAGVYGGYQLELSEDEKDKGDYITRRFKLSPVDKPQESRMVTQFHFIRWPKTIPPVEPNAILDLIDELQRVQRKSGNGPITVHCDNGLGRTGAFCTLYTVLERVKAEQVVDVFQAVKTLRIQRVGILETIEEYEFVHKAVLKFLDAFSDYQNFK